MRYMLCLEKKAMSLTNILLGDESPSDKGWLLVIPIVRLFECHLNQMENGLRASAKPFLFGAISFGA